MRKLFDIGTPDRQMKGRILRRDSARAIIILGGKVAMVHSLKYDYYKFPGGGIEEGESRQEALIRETLEESGLRVIPESVKEYGVVRRQEPRNRKYDYFLQDNFYYLCDVYPGVARQDLDDYESDERFTLEYVDPAEAAQTNLTGDHGPKSPVMLTREARVLELLIKEGYFG